MLCATARRVLTYSTDAQWRSCATAAGSGGKSVVDEIVLHVRNNCQGKPDEAVDVLKSGLARDTNEQETARLLLALAEVEAERDDWAKAALCAADAAAAVGNVNKPSHSNLQCDALIWSARANLVLGKDSEAQQLTDSEALHGDGADPLRPGRCWRWLVQRASGLSVSDASSKAVPRAANLETRPDCAKIAALEAQQSGDHAIAVEYAEHAINSAGGRGMSPATVAEVRADALMLKAQAAMQQHGWEDAEEGLNAAVSAAEEVGGDQHTRVALPLVLLGSVYGQTQRFSLAEGLYRQAAKMLRLTPGEGREPAHTQQALHRVHPTTAALLGWRYAQLLSAFPNRGTEADAWSGLARDVFRSPKGSGSVEAWFGSLDALKKPRQEGQFTFLDMSIRRVLPPLS